MNLGLETKPHPKPYLLVGFVIIQRYLLFVLCSLHVANVQASASHVIGNFGIIVRLYWMRIMHVKGCVM